MRKNQPLTDRPPELTGDLDVDTDAALGLALRPPGRVAHRRRRVTKRRGGRMSAASVLAASGHRCVAERVGPAG